MNMWKKKESKRRIITSERKFGEVDSKYIGEYRTTWSEKKIILIDGCRRKEK